MGSKKDLFWLMKLRIHCLGLLDWPDRKLVCFEECFVVPCGKIVSPYLLTWVRHGSSKSSATHSNQCVQCFCVSKQWYGCQCLGLLTCAQVLMYKQILMRVCTDTVRESALEAVSGRKIPCHTETRTRVSIVPGFSVYHLRYPHL